MKVATMAARMMTGARMTTAAVTVKGDGDNDDGDNYGGMGDEVSRWGRGDGDGVCGVGRCRHQGGGSVSNWIRTLNNNGRHGSGGDDGRYTGVGVGGRW